MFQNKKIGLDISDRNIEVVELVRKQKKYQILKSNRLLLPTGIVTRGRISNPQRLEIFLKKLFDTAKPNSIQGRDIVFALPESQVYTHVFKLDSHPQKERINLIQEEIIRTIPLDIDNISFNYQILNEDETGVEILLVAANTKIIIEWYRFFKKIGLKVDTFDIETLALFKGLAVKKLPVCIVDIGSATSNITIFNKKGLAYVYSLSLAGNHWTDKLAQVLGVDFKIAEKKKKTINISGRTKGARVLTKELDLLVIEIKKVLEYYFLQHKTKIDEIILLGGSSKLKGLEQYLASKFKNQKITVQLGKAILKNRLAVEYIEAIGVAVQAFDKQYLDNTLHFDLRKILKNYQQQQLNILKNQKKVKRIKKVELAIDVNTTNHKSKLITLIIILGIGVILIAIAFWYRSVQNQHKKDLIILEQKKLLEIPETISETKNTSTKNTSTTDLDLGLSGSTSSDQVLPEVSSSTPTTSDMEIELKLGTIVVKDNSAGYLNVRAGAGTGYDILQKIYPQEEYDLIKKDGSWYQIKINDQKTGWVYRNYVSLKDNK